MHSFSSVSINSAILVHGHEALKVLLNPVHFTHDFSEITFIIIDAGIMIADLKGSLTHCFAHTLHFSSHFLIVHDTYCKHFIQSPQIIFNVHNTYAFARLCHSAYLSRNADSSEMILNCRTDRVTGFVHSLKMNNAKA